jgi:hypothetical protein
MWQAREKLAEYKINGEQLIKMKKGDKRKNILTEFSIKYDLLLRLQNNDRITTEEPQNNDRTMTEQKGNNDSMDILPLFCDSSQNVDIGIHSKIRSEEIDQKRGEEEEEVGPGPVQTSKVIHDSEDKEPPPPIISDSDRESFDKARKAIELYFDKNYFTSRRGLMPKKREMMIEIGKYPDNLIKSAIEKKGNGIRNPEYLISNVLDELKANGNGHKDIDPKKAERQSEIDKLNEYLPKCNNKDDFWKLLKRAAEISSIPNPIEYLYVIYKPDRIKLNATEDYEWFFKYCQDDEGVKG